MRELKLIPTSNYVFTLHGVNERGEVALRRTYVAGRSNPSSASFADGRSARAVRTIASLGRILGGLGRRVRLRPRTTFVPMKSAETQTNAMILSVRELLVKQRTQAINALRGHASEFGVVAAKGTSNVEASSPTLRGILRSRKQPRTCSQNSVRMSQNCQRA